MDDIAAHRSLPIQAIGGVQHRLMLFEGPGEADGGAN